MRILPAVVLGLSLALSSVPAQAAMSLNQAVRVVQQRTDGRILAAETVRRGDRLVHRIKVLTAKGHVRVIEIDGGPAPGRGRRG